MKNRKYGVGLMTRRMQLEQSEDVLKKIEVE